MKTPTHNSTSTIHRLVGLGLSAQQAQMLKSTTSPAAYPKYVAVPSFRDRVHALIAALRSPAQAVYATCKIPGRDVDFVAVPFEALKREEQFALACTYCFAAADVPGRFHARMHLPCSVTDYHATEQKEGTHIMLPLEVAPPWDALSPAYVGCMEQADRVALLQSVTSPGTYLLSTTLLVEDREPRYRAYRATPFRSLDAGARGQLERVERPDFFCLYDSNQGVHPLLRTYYRHFVLCRVEDVEPVGDAGQKAQSLQWAVDASARQIALDREEIAARHAQLLQVTDQLLGPAGIGDVLQVLRVPDARSFLAELGTLCPIAEYAPVPFDASHLQGVRRLKERVLVTCDGDQRRRFMEAWLELRRVVSGLECLEDMLAEELRLSELLRPLIGPGGEGTAEHRIADDLWTVLFGA